MIEDNNIKNSIKKPLNSLIKVAQSLKNERAQRTQQQAQPQVAFNPQPIQQIQSIQQPIVPQQQIVQQLVNQPIQQPTQQTMQQPMQQPTQQPIDAEREPTEYTQTQQQNSLEYPNEIVATNYEALDNLVYENDFSADKGESKVKDYEYSETKPDDNLEYLEYEAPTISSTTSNYEDQVASAKDMKVSESANAKNANEDDDMWHIGRNSVYNFDINEVIDSLGGRRLDSEIGNIDAKFYPLDEDVQKAKEASRIVEEVSATKVLIMDTVSSVIEEELDKFNAEKESASKDPLIAAAEKFARSQNPNASFDADGNKVEKKKYSSYDHLDDMEKGMENDISYIDGGPMKEISSAQQAQQDAQIQQPIAPQQSIQPQQIEQQIQQPMQSQSQLDSEPQPIQQQLQNQAPQTQYEPKPIPQVQQAPSQNAQPSQSKDNNQPTSNQVSAGTLNVDAISQMIGSGSLIKRFENQQSSQ